MPRARLAARDGVETDHAYRSNRHRRGQRDELSPGARRPRVPRARGGARPSVDEAKAVLGRERPNLVLLNLQIPGGGGELVLRGIRATPALESVPVVAFTAFAMRGNRERLLAAGFDGYIAKPIDVREFGPTVESLLRR